MRISDEELARRAAARAERRRFGELAEARRVGFIRGLTGQAFCGRGGDSEATAARALGYRDGLAARAHAASVAAAQDAARRSRP